MCHACVASSAPLADSARSTRSNVEIQLSEVLIAGEGEHAARMANIPAAAEMSSSDDDADSDAADANASPEVKARSVEATRRKRRKAQRASMAAFKVPSIDTADGLVKFEWGM